MSKLNLKGIILGTALALTPINFSGCNSHNSLNSPKTTKYSQEQDFYRRIDNCSSYSSQEKKELKKMYKKINLKRITKEEREILNTSPNQRESFAKESFAYSKYAMPAVDPLIDREMILICRKQTEKMIELIRSTKPDGSREIIVVHPPKK